jgi:hypothetical protein
MIFLPNGGQVDMDQDKSNKNLFSSVLYLKSVLGNKNTLQIIHPDAVWMALFTWNNPIDKSIAIQTKELIEKEIPEDLIEFWTHISDGATLYYDQKYGQWGYKIYSSSEILNQQIRWGKLFRDSWRASYLVIGEIIDEDHPIFSNINEISKDNLSYSMFEGNSLDPIDYWVKMAPSFHEWVDHLITAQGAKFWDWK